MGSTPAEERQEILSKIENAKGWEAVKPLVAALPGAYRDDAGIMAAAIRRDPETYLLASERLQADKGLTVEAVSRLGPVLCSAPDALKADREVVSAATANLPDSLYCADPSLKHDRGFVLDEVGKGGRAYDYAAKELKADPEIATAAVASYPDMLPRVPEAISEQVRTTVEAQISLSSRLKCSLLGDAHECRNIETLRTPLSVRKQREADPHR